MFLNQGRVVSGCRIVRSEQAGSHRRPEENIRQERKIRGEKRLSNFALIELFSMRTGAMILHTVVGGFPSNFMMGKMCVELSPPSSSKLGSPSGPEGLELMRELNRLTYN